ncbi:MAG: histidine--tRNA ligase [Pseudomonadota bacterium]
MAKPKKTARPKATAPRGFIDTPAAEMRATAAMIARIQQVYESYGFEPLDTPAFEYTEALGKFLPDVDRPNEGVFSIQDEDEQWMSLRYDLTAPLARYVAQNFERLPRPFRRYAYGPIWRNEKPGPGRYRQFIQFDADTVGTDAMTADAEICMLFSDTMEALGIARGQYVIRLNNRKLLDGVLEGAGLAGEAHAGTRLGVLRAIDKCDRLGIEGVRALLGEGRKDESGDFTRGAGLDLDAVTPLIAYIEAGREGRSATLDALRPLVEASEIGREGLEELARIDALLSAAGYEADQVAIEPTVVRGLEYYTGPVMEAELTFEAHDDEGRSVRFGSVGGGGRYDGLVARFKGTQMPAVGCSVGVSRLQAALRHLGLLEETAAAGPVVVLVMDHADVVRYQRLTQTLRRAGVRAEMYLGTAGMKAQMKYADKRQAPCVVIQGGDEIAAGTVQIKDLVEGARLSETISDAKAWREGRPAQVSVPEAEMVEAVRRVLARDDAEAASDAGDGSAAAHALTQDQG